MPRKVNLLGYLQRMLPMLLIWGTMVHEYGHLIALRLMGLVGEIRSTGLNLTWLINGATPTQITIWRFAGGFLQAIYGVYNMIHESDNETWLSGLTVACQGIIYALYETQNLTTLGALFSVVFTVMVLILLEAKDVIKFD